MPKKELTLVSKILLNLAAIGDLAEPFINIHEFKKRSLYGSNYNSYRNTLYQLHKRGWIQFEDKNNTRFVKLTKKGQLEALAAKMGTTEKPKTWDGQWRVVVFDIPEASKLHRHRLRALLKKQGFKFLQASVWISPHPLQREAIHFLKESKLIAYIRIMRVAEMDTDVDLRKKFNVSKPSKA